MIFAGIAKTTLLDFPGRLACVLFTSGCPYDCFYCHNRTAIDGSAVGVSPEQVLQFLKRRQGMLEGVVVSGGEPTLQKDLESFMENLKELGYAVKLDTNGCNPSVVRRSLEAGLLDYVALDIKAPWMRYQEICGKHADPRPVQETLEMLRFSTIGWEVRTTVAPTLGREDLMEIARQMPTVPTWRLNLYRIPEKYRPEETVRVLQAAASVTELQEWSLPLRLVQPNLLEVD